MELQFCDSMSRFDSASIDDSIYRGQQFLDADLSYRSPADPRKDVGLLPAQDLIGMAFNPSRRLLGEPFTSHDLIAVCRSFCTDRLGGFPVRTGVDARR